MASQYSPDLRIELIGTGEQAGVWGATTNNNLTYVLEQAIAGYVSVSVISANQALTYLNGASTVAAENQSVHSALALTTTTGANFSVYAPPSSKQYTIYNASSYVATIYNSTVIGNTTAAGTGVAIPAGKTMTVWSDGTNMASQISHLPNLSLTTALPVTSGGSGTTTSTGTGSVVLSASPTFTGTPLAPTAASGTNTTQLATTAFVQTAVGPTTFASGTALLFSQTSAPTGWTKSTTHNNKALRVVSGTVSSGGSVPFTTAFASQTPAGSVSVSLSAGGSVSATTLSTTQIPSHSHGVVGNVGYQVGTNQSAVNLSCFATTGGTLTGNAGGGGSHTHSFTNPTYSGSFTGSAIDLAVQYVDVIIATKD